MQTKSLILSNERMTEDYWRMVLKVPLAGFGPAPGQFINVKIGGPNGVLFRRPFSVFRSVALGGADFKVEIVYKVVGRGTRIMAQLKEGDELDIIGPLGKGFHLDDSKKVHVLLAGGIGSAGLFMVGKEISDALKERGLALYILLGAQTKKNLVLEKEFAELNGKMLVSTDDGSYGHKGFVTEMVRNAIESNTISRDCLIYACGPEPMLEALATICKYYDIPAQVSIERPMMCGIGACLACVCKVDKSSVLKYRDLTHSHIQLSPEEEFGYALVCKDGPVFNIRELMFDE